MLNFIFRHPIAVILAIILHLLLGAGFIVSSFHKDKILKVHLSGAPEHIQPKIKTLQPLKTFAVDATQVQKQLARIKAQEQARLNKQKHLAAQTAQEKRHLALLQKKQLQAKRKAQAERKKALAAKRKADASKILANIEHQKAEAQKKRVLVEKKKAEQAKKEAAMALKKRKEADKRIAEAKKQHILDEQKSKQLQAEIQKKSAEKKRLEQAALEAKLEKEQQEEEASLQKQIAAVEAKKRAIVKAKQMKHLQETYVSSIASKVKNNWRTAGRINPKAQCEVAIVQTTKGQLTSVRILNCNKAASKQFRKDAEKAVYRSQPLPAPPIPELFERHIQFVFKP